MAEFSFFALFIALIVVASGFDTVDANQKAVVMRFGEPIAELGPGVEWTGPMANIETYSTLTRKMSVVIQGNNYAPSVTQQKIFAKVALNYRISEQSGTVTALKSNFGSDSDLENKLNMEALVVEGIKQAISKYTAEEIQANREAVKAFIKEKVIVNFPNEYFVLDNIIVENIWFAEDYQAAIDSIASATKRAEAKEMEQNIVDKQNLIDVSLAQKAREVRMKAADAAAYEITANANAEAAAIRVKAQAEADGLAAKKAELTQLMVEQTKWEQWNGVMPTHIMGDTDVLMSMN